MTKLILPNDIDNLKMLDLRDNNLNQDLSFLQRAVDLKVLGLGNNKLHGSLEFLQNLNKLEILDISDTDLDSGLEYLPDSLGWFSCSAGKKDAKCQTIYNLFADEKGEVETDNYGIENFPQKLKDYKQKTQEQQQAQVVQPASNKPK